MAPVLIRGDKHILLIIMIMPGWRMEKVEALFSVNHAILAGADGPGGRGISYGMADEAGKQARYRKTLSTHSSSLEPGLWAYNAMTLRRWRNKICHNLTE
ncbi:hypothetical protein ACL2XQ_22120 [Sodalis sp. RH14]|uniref:hypothetical protein n=1 Tax=Sodalis sp. RH14 TaxID=3394329 RepID=UPI0039B3EB87